MPLDLFNWSWFTEKNSELSFLPVITYLNADIEKLSIIKDNKDKSGVYKWTNLENGNCYIGSSVNLSRRLAQYYNLNFLTKFRKNSLIHKALLKYGYSNFKLEILEYCNREDAIKREQYYMDTFKPEYNILKFAGSALGHKHSAETIENLRLKATGRKHTIETLAKMMGRTHSEATKNKIKCILRAEEVRKKMVDAFSKRTGVKVSAETRVKMLYAQANRDWVTVAGVKVEVKDLSTNLVTVYDSINKAAEALQIPKGTIARRVKLNIEKPLLIKKDIL
nr:GIY-YIG endonuclease [Monilinia laxa]QOE17410.1 GIY-YIG endonuclease [Monilinia laxa]QYB19844.1 GIY-YIG endonuclease [Monilinia laxa]QYB19929.1 GIY-YIG endonuclease [Monilinia laxa]QYB20105.1 GIY-YIG endonuclease [Monilinia laxa]QYB20171.1 GIY-YIG endonuclease [Monilinia laxa]